MLKREAALFLRYKKPLNFSMQNSMAIPFLGRIPIDPKIVDSGDNGFAYIYDYAKAPAGKAMQEIVNKIIAETKEKREAWIGWLGN